MLHELGGETIMLASTFYWKTLIFLNAKLLMSSNVVWLRIRCERITLRDIIAGNIILFHELRHVVN